MKVKFLYMAFWLLACGIFSACEDDDNEDPEIISAVAGDFVGAENCDGTEYGDYEILIYNTSFGQNEVWLHNLWDSGADIRATVSGNTFTAAEQEIDLGGDIYKFTADGSVTNKVLSLNFKITDPDGAVSTCTFTGTSD